jgi:hypothetical protein
VALTPLPTRVLSPTDLGVPPPDGMLFMAAMPGIPRLSAGPSLGMQLGKIMAGIGRISWNILE